MISFKVFPRNGCLVPGCFSLAAQFNEQQLLSYLLMNASLTNYSSVMCTSFICTFVKAVPERFSGFQKYVMYRTHRCSSK